tara:strand:- start:3313 stop:4416 length:1104 start_codon:yes stop_codon:yes gene_type:complete
MSKISNTTAYPTTAPASGDLLIGTDINDSNATKTFTIGSVVALTPDNTLAEVLTAGNTATNNIILTGDITCTNIIPTNIKDAAGNTGTVGQHLVKNAANALEWGAGSADTLANVLAAGNTATTYIALSGPTGYLTATYVAPIDIKDNAGNLGTASQTLVKSAANALAWETVASNTLAEVLAAGNTATNNITLTGNVTCTNLTATQDVNGDVFNATTQVSTPLMDATDIQDNANLNGTAGQYLRKSSPGNVLAWETVAAPTLSTVLAAGNTATNDITLTGNIALTGNLTGTGDITRTGAVTITGGITSTATVEGSALKGNSGVPLKVPGIDTYADDAAAAALATGDVYMTSGTAAAPLNVAGILMVKQ